MHRALQRMKDGKVRRLRLIAVDDILLRTELTSLGKEPEPSSDEVVRTYRAITRRQVPQVAKQAAAA
jgi:hypothetical protein